MDKMGAGSERLAQQKASSKFEKFEAEEFGAACSSLGAAYAEHEAIKAGMPAPQQEAVSRHSPEGFDEVLRMSLDGPTPTESQRDRAVLAAKLLAAWAAGERLEARPWHIEEGGWEEYVGDMVPNVVNTSMEWRIKRTPRKVYVAFHPGGSVADVRASKPESRTVIGLNPENYVEMEEVLS